MLISLLITDVEGRIEELKSIEDYVRKYNPDEKYSLITANVKRNFLFKISELISANKLRLSNLKRNDVDLVVKMLADDTFVSRNKISLDTNTIDKFKALVEIAINITKKHNLQQTNINHLGLVVAGVNKRNPLFNVHEHLDLFNPQIDSVMKNRKEIYSVEYYTETEWNGDIRNGVYIRCK